MRVAALIAFAALSAAATQPGGLAERPHARPYLSMPPTADGALPPLLSQTGAFVDIPHLIPSPALIPYDLIVPFWSDGAEKLRWVSVPEGQHVQFAPTGEWGFPKGTAFVKTFEIPIDETQPELKRRLETRLLVCNSEGGVYGVTYKWRPDNSDADLLTTNLTETLSIKTRDGTRTQTWYYPSRQDCLTCHTANAHFVLGVKTRQMNREFNYPSGVENQLHAWSRFGLFDTALDDQTLAHLPTLAAPGDTSRSLEDRARSYLDANCAHCHRPNGTVAYFDARYDTPLPEQNLVDGRVLIDERIDNPRIIKPNDIWRSILYMRANTVEAFKMPPLARNTIDEKGMALLHQWIESLPGPTVLRPPSISPPGGNFHQPMEAVLKSEPGAVIHYTLDGTVPTKSDPQYEKPIPLNAPTILRAKAFKPGCEKSITAQGIFIIGS